MPSLTIPLSGHLLVSHLAAYGLGVVLDANDEDAFVGHDPLSLEMEPHVTTPANVERTVDLVRQSATTCERVIEADLQPGQTGNNRRPVIWARATALDRAKLALPKREALLEAAERDEQAIVVGLLAGLGAPAAWSDRPQRGASRLDGVTGNHTSDFVRGVLRRARPAAASAQVDGLASAWSGKTSQAASVDDDKTGWSPPGTRVDLVHQWLAALGLSLLTVGQSAHGRAATPCFCRHEARGVTLPVLDHPVSVPRLRGLLQLPELLLPAARLVNSEAARLRARGIRELVAFALVDRSTPQSTAFSFARGVRVEL